MQPDGLKVSLIMGTLGRTTELARFLQHLDRQTYRNFELIVVDQNLKGFLDPVLAPYRDCFPILHLRSERGLSRARNVGLKHATGDIFAFPDDDCWYPPELLAEVTKLFADMDWDGVSVRPCDPERLHSFAWYGKSGGEINRFNVWRRCISFTIFFRRSLVNKTGDFDEGLGPGSTTTTGAEETDYVIRAIQANLRILYVPQLRVFHFDTQRVFDSRLVRDGYLKSLGFMLVLRRHKYPTWFVLYFCLRPLAGAVISLLRLNFQKARYHYSVLQGRITGWAS